MQSSVSTQQNKKIVGHISNQESGDQDFIRWTYACKLLNPDLDYEIEEGDLDSPPNPGDIALFKVTNVGTHTRIITVSNQKLRIYVGDLFVGVFGNRYATDALEAEVDSVRNLSLLTTAGMVGSVKSKHASIHSSTEVAFLGYLTSSQIRMNSKKIAFTRFEKRNQAIDEEAVNLIVVIGSGMNSGKTTFCRKLIKSLSQQGARVAACKLTGSISPRDCDEMASASAVRVTDFSDYGFPSTYKCDSNELVDLFRIILNDLAKLKADVIIMEVADGVLQRETKMILNEPLFKKLTRGIIVTADSAPAALYTVQYLERLGYMVLSVSGIISSSPLYTKEFVDNRSSIPVISSETKTIEYNPIFENLLKFDTRSSL